MKENFHYPTTVAELLPDWSGSNKSDLSLKQMLSHYARLWPWIPFYKETLNRKGFPKKNNVSKGSFKRV
jgi:hypothetical protein